MEPSATPMPEDQPPSRTQTPGGSIDRALSSALRLNRALEGNLPCIICGYDLKGVTIRGSCPECGTLVRATILYTVDPEAEEFRPMLTPHITAWSMAAWTILSFVAILSAWWIRLADAAQSLVGFDLSTVGAWWILIVTPALAGICILGMVRPTSGAKWSASLAAFIAAAAHVPLVLLLIHLHTWDVAHASPFFGWTPSTPVPDEGGREVIRLGIGACILTIIFGIRPNVRELVRRSLAMRTGRVDRQTLLAMAAAVVLAGIGDGLRLGAHHLTGVPVVIMSGVGTVFIAIGSLFMTLGAASAVIDAWRIRRVILLPSPTLHEVLGTSPAPKPPTAPEPGPAPSTVLRNPPSSDSIPPPT